MAFVSNVTGRAMGAEECGRRRTGGVTRREAVRFADGMKALWDQGYRVFVEVGPSPTLLGMGRQCVAESEAAWIAVAAEGP